MIVRVTGRLESVVGNAAVVSLAPGEGPPFGLAYEVLVPAFTAHELEPRIGQIVAFYTLQSLEQQAQGSSFVPRLIGFQSPVDRQFFELFTTVKGVGTRKALKALAEPVGVIAAAIAERDVKSLKRLPEIGARMAETIVAELHGKVERFVLEGDRGDLDRAAGSVRFPLGETGEQVIEALIRLGETRPEAQRLVVRVVEAKPNLTQADEILAAAVSLR